MSASQLSASEFSRMAAALLAQSKGETAPEGVDLTNRKQLLAFAEALVQDDGSTSCSEEEPVFPATDDDDDEEDDEEPNPIPQSAAAQETRRT